MLRKWRLADLSSNVELVARERLANAVSAALRLDRPSLVRMWLASDGANALIAVWDTSPASP
jgi:hypothetical protein